MKISTHSEPVIKAPSGENPRSSPSGTSTLKKLLILGTLISTLFPLAATTGYLTYTALTEKNRYEKAPFYQDASHRPGELTRIVGTFTGELLNPKEYPEIINAIWFRVVSERRPGPDAPWHRDSTAPLVVQRIAHGAIGPLQIEIGLLSKLSLPMQRIEKNISPFHRLALEFKTVSIQEPIMAIGYLEKGTLKDGLFDRLLVLLPDHESDVLTAIGRKSYHKVFFLGGITLVFLGLMVVMIPPFRRGLKVIY
jgi:hypothetical protein